MHSGQVSPIARKRPIQSDSDLTEQPFKSQRSEIAMPAVPAPTPLGTSLLLPALCYHGADANAHASSECSPAQMASSLSNGPSHPLLAQAAATMPNGVQSLNASPTTPQTPFEFPQGQGLSGAPESTLVAQSMPRALLFDSIALHAEARCTMP